MNVHKLWMDAGGLRVTKDELKALDDRSEGRMLYVQRRLGTDVVLHPITRNGWAYKAVAELRGQQWPEGAEKITASERGFV